MVFRSYRRTSLFLAFFSVLLLAVAQAPSGYYSAAKGKSGKSLKTALYSIVSSHTARSYDQLWTDFKTTDVRPDGKIWDMYSNATSYVPGGSAQGKNYSGEGDSYNREHSFPKSWFNDAKPMYTDLFHLYPTDGYVNNRRSNYPFGETEGERYQSNGGFSKLGACTVDGYTGIVFEPADEYKGDFARTYFYMATAYEGQIASWSSPMLAGNAYPAYAQWALTMLLRWAEEDPVSEKEIARNNAVYGIQKNRNPYIDFPGLEQYVWGTQTTTAFDPDNYNGTEPTPGPKDVTAPTFSPASGVVAAGTEVTITTATEGAYIYFTVNGGDEQVLYPPVKLTVNENTTISAYAQMGEQKSETVTATYTLKSDTPAGSDVYTLVTNASELKAGTRVLIVCPSQLTAMAAISKDVRSYASVEVTEENRITTEVDKDGSPYSFTLGGSTGAWTFYDNVDDCYLALTSDANKLHTATTATAAAAQWTVTVSSDGTALITNNERTGRSIKYNQSSPRFACYKQGQKDVAIFAQSTPAGIDRLFGASGDKAAVYDLQGRRIATSGNAREALRSLPAGMYIVNGKKVIVK